MSTSERIPRPPLWQVRSLGAVRLALAVTCAIALVFRYIWGLGSITFDPGNFFGYLTIQSNILFTILSAISGVLALAGHAWQPRLHVLRTAVLTCTATSGIVFAVIVQQSALRAIRVDVPWSDVVLHYVLPAIAVVEWILTPRRRRAPWRIIPIVLVCVCGWGGVTMLRGSITGWYPYYFLDPRQTNGIVEFLLLSGTALAVFAVVGSAMIGVTAAGAAWSRRMARGSRERRPAGLGHRGQPAR